MATDSHKEGRQIMAKLPRVAVNDYPDMTRPNAVAFIDGYGRLQVRPLTGGALLVHPVNVHGDGAPDAG